MEQEESGRREVASRNTTWAHTVARFLAVRSVTPNQISVLSMVVSAIGGAILLYSAKCPSLSLYIAFAIYIICIQLRLLCNLFDGMVAIEGGKKTPNGDLYNDMPDRFSDAFLIIPAGYVAGGIGIELGWLAALLAIMTAYFRWIGAYKTQYHYFNGPMAKQHRMFLLTVAVAISLFVVHSGYYNIVFLIMLIVMNILLAATLINRLRLMSHSSDNNKKEN